MARGGIISNPARRRELGRSWSSGNLLETTLKPRSAPPPGPALKLKPRPFEWHVIRRPVTPIWFQPPNLLESTLKPVVSGLPPFDAVATLNQAKALIDQVIAHIGG